MSNVYILYIFIHIRGYFPVSISLLNCEIYHSDIYIRDNINLCIERKKES